MDSDDTFSALNSTSSAVYNLDLQAPSGPREQGAATFEIDGPLPPAGPFYLHLAHPPRSHQVVILESRPLPGGRTRLTVSF